MRSRRDKRRQGLPRGDQRAAHRLAEEHQGKPEVELRVRAGAFTGIARELHAEERQEAMEAYCESEKASLFEHLEHLMWRRGRPTPSRIRELHRIWFDQGTPLVTELRDP
jgi:hypothetical protein